MMASRPELTGHAALFYNQKEARKYNSSSRMIGVQREITERAIELLRLDASSATPPFVLDVGCGSGLSGQVLAENGYVWVGCDVSRDMLNVANERGVEAGRREKASNADNAFGSGGVEDLDDDDPTGDFIHHDMGTGLPFRPASFDACISISALQWLCYSNSKVQNPRTRLLRFFSSLHKCLRRGGRAVLQYYPETAEQVVLINQIATKVGFTGGVVVDYPSSTKAKKHYLVLSFDRSVGPRKLVTEEQLTGDQHVSVGWQGGAACKSRPPRKKNGVKTKEWIVHKKAMQRRKGKMVRPDTKYTGRRRPHKF